MEEQTRTPDEKQRKIDTMTTDSTTVLQLDDEVDHREISECYAGLSLPDASSMAVTTSSTLTISLEQASEPKPEVLIEAIRARNVDLIIALTNIPRVRSWLHIPDRGKTAGYYALNPLNLALLKRLLACGLDPEQPLAISKEQTSDEWQPQGLIQFVETYDLLVRKAVFKVLEEHYKNFPTTLMNEIAIDDETLSTWQDQLEDTSQSPDAITYRGLHKQLIQAIKYHSLEKVDALLAQAKTKGLTAELCDQNGDNVLIVAACRRQHHGLEGPALVDRLITEFGMDAKKSAPHILHVAQSRLITGEDDSDGVGQCHSLVEVLKKHHDEATVFHPWSLKRWELRFTSYKILVDKSRIYFNVLKKDYVTASRELSSSSAITRFMCDPFSLPLFREYRKADKLETPTLYTMVMKDLTTVPRRVNHPTIQHFLATIIDRASPKTINQLSRGKALLHHLAETPDCEAFIEALCKKPGIEVNLPDGKSYPPLYRALEKGRWSNAKTLREFGAKLNLDSLKELWDPSNLPTTSQFEFANHLLDLGINPFDIASLDTLLFLNDSSSQRNHKEYLAKLMKIIPATEVNKSVPISCRLTRFSYQHKDGAKKTTPIQAPLAVILGIHQCANLIESLIPKGLDLNLPVVFEESQAFDMPIDAPPTKLLWHVVQGNEAGVLTPLLEQGADPRGLSTCLAIACEGSSHLTQFLIKILLRNLSDTDGEKINILFDGQPLSYWVAQHGKKFNWSEEVLEPIVIMMISKKVNYQIFVEQAKDYPLLLSMLEKYKPKQDAKTAAPVRVPVTTPAPILASAAAPAAHGSARLLTAETALPLLRTRGTGINTSGFFDKSAREIELTDFNPSSTNASSPSLSE